MPIQFALQRLASAISPLAETSIDSNLAIQNYGTHLRAVKRNPDPATILSSKRIDVAGITSPIVAVVFVPLVFQKQQQQQHQHQRRVLLLVVEGTGAASLIHLDCSDEGRCWEQDVCVAPTCRSNAAIHGCANNSFTEFRNDISTVATDRLLSACHYSQDGFAAVMCLPSDAALPSTSLTVCVFSIKGATPGTSDDGEHNNEHPPSLPSLHLSAGSTVLRGPAAFPSVDRSNGNGSTQYSRHRTSLCCSVFGGKVYVDAIVASSAMAPVLVAASMELHSGHFRSEAAWLLSPVAARSPALCFSPYRESVSVVEAKWISVHVRVLLMRVHGDNDSASDVSVPSRWIVINAAARYRRSLAGAAHVGPCGRAAGGGAVERRGGMLLQSIASGSVDDGEEFDVFVVVGDSVAQAIEPQQRDEKEMGRDLILVEQKAEQPLHNHTALAAPVAFSAGRVTASAQCPATGELFFTTTAEHGVSDDAGTPLLRLLLRRTTLVEGGPALLAVAAEASASDIAIDGESPWNRKCSAVWCFGEGGSDSSPALLFVFAQLGHDLSLFRFDTVSGELMQVAVHIRGGYSHVSQCAATEFVLVPQEFSSLVPFFLLLSTVEDRQQRQLQQQEGGIAASAAALALFPKMIRASTSSLNNSNISSSKHEQQRVTTTTTTTTTCSASTDGAVIAHVSSGALLLLLMPPVAEASSLIAVSRGGDDRHFVFDRIGIASSATEAASPSLSSPQQKAESVHRAFTVCASSLTAFGQVFVGTLFVFSDRASAALTQLRIVDDSKSHPLHSSAITSIVPFSSSSPIDHHHHHHHRNCWALLSQDGSVSVVVPTTAAKRETTEFSTTTVDASMTRMGIAPAGSALSLHVVDRERSKLLLRGAGATQNYVVDVVCAPAQKRDGAAVNRRRVSLTEESDGFAASILHSDATILAVSNSSKNSWLFAFEACRGILAAQLVDSVGARSIPRSIAETISIPVVNTANSSSAVPIMSVTCLVSIGVQHNSDAYEFELQQQQQQQRRTACSRWTEERCLVAAVRRWKQPSVLCILPATRRETHRPLLLDGPGVVTLPFDAGFVTCGCEVTMRENTAHNKVLCVGTSGGFIFVVAVSASSSGNELRTIAQWSPPPPISSAAAAMLPSKSFPVLAMCRAEREEEEEKEERGERTAVVDTQASGLIFVSLQFKIVALQLMAANATATTSSRKKLDAQESLSLLVELASFDTLDVLSRNSNSSFSDNHDDAGVLVLRDVVSIDSIPTGAGGSLGSSYSIICGSSSAGVCVLKFSSAQSGNNSSGNNTHTATNAIFSFSVVSADPVPANVLFVRWAAQRDCRSPTAGHLYIVVDATRNIMWARSSPRDKKHNSGAKKKKKKKNGGGGGNNGDDDDDCLDSSNARRSDDDQDDDEDDLFEEDMRAKTQIKNKKKAASSAAATGAAAAAAASSSSSPASPGRPLGASSSHSPTRRESDQVRPTHLAAQSTAFGGGAKLPFSVAHILPLSRELAPRQQQYLSSSPAAAAGKRSIKPSSSFELELNPYAACQALPLTTRWQVGAGLNFLFLSPTGETMSCCPTNKDVFDLIGTVQRFLAETFTAPTSPGAAGSTPTLHYVPPLALSSPMRRSVCQHFVFSFISATWWNCASANVKQQAHSKMTDLFPLLTLEQLDTLVCNHGCFPSFLL